MAVRVCALTVILFCKYRLICFCIRIDPVVDFGIGLCPRILCDAKIHYWIDNKCLFDSILMSALGGLNLLIICLDHLKKALMLMKGCLKK